MTAYIDIVFNVDLPGQSQDGSQVRFVRIKCGNTLSQVTSAGFLDKLVESQGLSIYPSDFVFVAASDGNQVYAPTISAGSITLGSLG